jgi:hypothetical protein
VEYKKNIIQKEGRESLAFKKDHFQLSDAIRHREFIAGWFPFGGFRHVRCGKEQVVALIIPQFGGECILHRVTPFGEKAQVIGRSGFYFCYIEKRTIAIFDTCPQ